MSTYVLSLSCLCAGLLFDPNGFLRMSLVASFIHELGHIIVYLCFVKKAPPIGITFGGLSLKNTNLLNSHQEFFVIVAGPLANFLTAFIIYIFIIGKSTYMRWFFFSINICIGIYNLLPFGVLDGARLLSVTLSSCKVGLLYAINKWLVVLFSVALIVFSIVSKTDLLIKFGLCIASLYILYCEFNR